MKAVKEEFPNPVLASGRDDYNDGCSFGTFFEEDKITVDKEDITIPIKYELVCNGLESLIQQGKALTIVLVKSSAASYSKLFKFDAGTKEMSISVPKFSVVNKIEVTGSVVAASDIKDFKCEEFNDLYFGSSTFEIRKGDILATEDSRTIFVDNTELEKPLSSIFEISKMEEQENDVVPTFDDEKIKIFLKTDLYNLYYHFKDFNNGALRRYATGIVVYPVLVEAVTYVIGIAQNGDDPGDYSDKRWFRAISLKTENLGINLETTQEAPTTIADLLLGGISLDALKSFKDTLDSEINSGESQMIGGID